MTRDGVQYNANAIIFDALCNITWSSGITSHVNQNLGLGNLGLRVRVKGQAYLQSHFPGMVGGKKAPEVKSVLFCVHRSRNGSDRFTGTAVDPPQMMRVGVLSGAITAPPEHPETSLKLERRHLTRSGEVK